MPKHYNCFNEKIHLAERLEQGDMQFDSKCYAEFMRRMEEEEGTLYHNTPEDEARWFADIAAVMHKK